MYFLLLKSEGDTSKKKLPHLPPKHTIIAVYAEKLGENVRYLMPSKHSTGHEVTIVSSHSQHHLLVI